MENYSNLVDTAAWQSFREELKRESERGSALVGAAYLDDLLGQLLQSYFGLNKGGYKLLLDPKNRFALLSNLAAKIDMGTAIGLFPKDVGQDLHRIRSQPGYFLRQQSSLQVVRQLIPSEGRRCVSATESNASRPI